MIPDIVVEISKENKVVLDTKWKNIGENNPSPEDLRQMYAYSKFNNKAKTALVYPSYDFHFQPGHFMLENDHFLPSETICGLMKLAVIENITEWQKGIAQYIFKSVLFTDIAK